MSLKLAQVISLFAALVAITPAHADPKAAPSLLDAVAKIGAITEVTFPGSITTTPSGHTSITPSTFWIGERVYVQGNRCMHVSQKLLRMDVIKTPAGRVEAPVLKTITRDVDCAGGVAGGLSWTGSLSEG